MNNKICIQPCKFIDRIASEDIISYGYRCYDDYGNSYNNLWSKKDIKMSPTRIFEKACKERENDSNLDIILSYIEKLEKGIWIGDTKLEWEQIKDIIKEKKPKEK